MIGAVPFLVLAADDEPEPGSVRDWIERNAIDSLGTIGIGVDPPSPARLNRDCPHPLEHHAGWLELPALAPGEFGLRRHEFVAERLR